MATHIIFNISIHDNNFCEIKTEHGIAVLNIKTISDDNVVFGCTVFDKILNKKGSTSEYKFKVKNVFDLISTQLLLSYFILDNKLKFENLIKLKTLKGT